MSSAIRQHELYDFLGLKRNFEFYSKELPGNFLFTLCTKIKSGTCAQSVQLSKELIFSAVNVSTNCMENVSTNCKYIRWKITLCLEKSETSLDGEKFRRILWIKTWDNEV